MKGRLTGARGIASHDTLNDVLNALDGELFAACFTAWVAAVRDAEPDIDGKTSRRSHARAKGRHPLHLVSAWASRQRLVLGQQAYKSNEITAIPRLLERQALSGALVTIDAMGSRPGSPRPSWGAAPTTCWRSRRTGPPCMARSNATSPTRRRPSWTALTPPTARTGRIEVRRHALGHEVAWLSSDRRFPGEPRFPGLAAIAMVEAEVERHGRTSRERRCFLSSARLDARLFAHAVRCHWHLEKRLHWVMDLVFHDDLCRLRSGCGPQNMAVVRHMAMNLLRAAPGKQSFAVRREKASWNTDYLETLIRQES